MHISGMKNSKFLTRNDAGRGILVTVRGVHEENVAKEGAPPEMKWCVTFDETDKPMVLNNTNAQIIASIAKSEETDNWPGTKVVLYDDPNVSFGGKLVGGIRVRAPRVQGANQTQGQARAAQQQPRQAPPPDPPQQQPYDSLPPGDGDDIPFSWLALIATASMAMAMMT